MKLWQSRRRIIGMVGALALAGAVALSFTSLSGCGGGGDDGGGGGNTLNVNIWLVSIPDYSGQGVTNLQTMITEFIRLMNALGLNIGDVQIIELSGSPYDSMTFVYTQGQLDALFRLSSQAPNDNYLNFFLIRDLGGGGGILGIAGAIPRPVEKGTSESGVAINTFGGLTRMTAAGLLMQGNTMAHEAGHYLGLWHTTEREGTVFDPLSDTPECPAATFDTDRDGLVSALECVSRDAYYMMFSTPFANFAAQDIISGQQQAVALSHGLVQ